MIVGNQLTPFMSRYSKIVVRQSIVSHDNFVVYLFYFENSNYLNRSDKKRNRPGNLYLRYRPSDNRPPIFSYITVAHAVTQPAPTKQAK